MVTPQADLPTPTALTVHSTSRVLEIAFSDGAEFKIPFELMRVYSPSAEVQGHGLGQEVLQTGKQGVQIIELTTVGNYAVKPVFNDGHDTGLFTWPYLYKLGAEQDAMWSDYLHRLSAAGIAREQPMLAASSAACSKP